KLRAGPGDAHPALHKTSNDRGVQPARYESAGRTGIRERLAAVSGTRKRPQNRGNFQLMRLPCTENQIQLVWIPLIVRQAAYPLPSDRLCRLPGARAL